MSDQPHSSDSPQTADCPSATGSALTPAEGRYVEGYAAALQDILRLLTGEDGCAKSYDPMTVSRCGRTLHSYAFDMLDGGRHHAVSDYAGIEDITATLLREVEATIRDEYEPNVKDVQPKERQ